MTQRSSTLTAIALLALSALTAQAQDNTADTPRDAMHERMKSQMVRRAADLKAQLKLTPEQDKAWTSYIAAMKPPADTARPNRSDMDKLTTPERLEKMREMRKQHDALMDQRIEATKAFYATLTPEQQKTFDTHARRRQSPWNPDTMMRR